MASTVKTSILEIQIKAFVRFKRENKSKCMCKIWMKSKIIGLKVIGDNTIMRALRLTMSISTTTSGNTRYPNSKSSSISTTQWLSGAKFSRPSRGPRYRTSVPTPTSAKTLTSEPARTGSSASRRRGRSTPSFWGTRVGSQSYTSSTKPISWTTCSGKSKETPTWDPRSTTCSSTKCKTSLLQPSTWSLRRSPTTYSTRATRLSPFPRESSSSFQTSSCSTRVKSRQRPSTNRNPK